MDSTLPPPPERPAYVEAECISDGTLAWRGKLEMWQDPLEGRTTVYIDGLAAAKLTVPEMRALQNWLTDALMKVERP